MVNESPQVLRVLTIGLRRLGAGFACGKTSQEFVSGADDFLRLIRCQDALFAALNIPAIATWAAWAARIANRGAKSRIRAPSAMSAQDAQEEAASPVAFGQKWGSRQSGLDADRVR
jgi:hypothetical protein